MQDELQDELLAAAERIRSFEPDADGFTYDIVKLFHLDLVKLLYFQVGSPDESVRRFMLLIDYNVSEVENIIGNIQTKLATLHLQSLSQNSADLHDEEVQLYSNLSATTRLIFDMKTKFLAWLQISSSMQNPAFQNAVTIQEVHQMVLTATSAQQDEPAAEIKPFHEVYDFVMDRCFEQCLRHREGILFEPVFTEDGHNTRFYKEYKEVLDFVYNCTDRFTNERFFLLMTTGGNARQAADIMTNYKRDPRLRQHTASRYHFAFRNCIFSSEERKAYFFSPHENQASVGQLPADICCCQFIDLVLDPTWLSDEVLANPMLIKTPTVDKILKDQGHGEDVIYWVKVFLGRMCFNLGVHDDWQICLFFRGVAGSGKSSLLKLFSKIYLPSDIGILMSDGQATFSDEHLLGKFVILAMDVDTNMKFSEARFNSFVSAEMVAVNRKFKTALNKEWESPMAMASNSGPPFKDRGGNCTRRFMITSFDKPIKNADTSMFKRLEKELGAFLISIVLCYHKAAKEHGHRSLWSEGLLPKTFHDAKKQYAAVHTLFL